LFIVTLIYLIKGNTGFDSVKMVTFEKNAKKENPNPLRKNKVVITSIHMGAGHNDSLGLVLASPYTNTEQQSQLYKYSTQIKNDFLMTVSEEKLKEWVKDRDFDDIKATFRKIVNKYLDEPVSEVYISSYFYE
jgi:flagellar basal body-associated protein FliL